MSPIFQPRHWNVVMLTLLVIIHVYSQTRIWTQTFQFEAVSQINQSYQNSIGTKSTLQVLIWCWSFCTMLTWTMNMTNLTPLAFAIPGIFMYKILFTVFKYLYFHGYTWHCVKSFCFCFFFFLCVCAFIYISDNELRLAAPSIFF